MKYRPDIDGLRAIAVIPVVLFHTGFGAFSGGFVGVDIFFVVSGYLITLIIVDDIRVGQFSIADFYERRIRRIFPALFSVMFFTILMSIVVLFPASFDAFGTSLVSTTLFVSNMLFWSESGYFDASAFGKPLLHTWSLAVEEQFYILFPLLLLITYRWIRFHWSYVLVPGALCSFGLAIYFVIHKPSLAFYWAPTRAWELFLGAFLALGLFPEIKNKLSREIVSMIGFMLILVAVFRFSEDTVFPGAAALLPCLGAALLIHTGTSGPSLVSKMLQARPLVSIGLISYSLYLWHWPLVVFSKNLLIRELSLDIKKFLVILSLFFAYLSWKFIKTPFRGKRSTLSRKGVFFLGASLMAIFL